MPVVHKTYFLFTGNTANQHGWISDSCVKFHFLHEISQSILKYFLKNLTTGLDRKKDYTSVKKEKSPQFQRVKSQ